MPLDSVSEPISVPPFPTLCFLTPENYLLYGVDFTRTSHFSASVGRNGGSIAL